MCAGRLERGGSSLIFRENGAAGIVCRFEYQIQIVYARCPGLEVLLEALADFTIINPARRYPPSGTFPQAAPPERRRKKKKEILEELMGRHTSSSPTQLQTELNLPRR